MIPEKFLIGIESRLVDRFGLNEEYMAPPIYTILALFQMRPGVVKVVTWSMLHIIDDQWEAW